MIALLFVADGPRDEATLPPIVQGILSKDLRPQFEPWARLHQGGKGYEKRLKYAIRQARFRRLEGLVAVADRDRDRDGDRLRALTLARTEARRTDLPFPVALGCAAPHVEKWLVSDRTALQQCFPNGNSDEFDALQASREPKDHLNTMFRDHDIQCMEGLVKLAVAVAVPRCGGKKDSGLAAFESDVRDELGKL